MRESERLAREIFALAEKARQTDLLPLVHLDAVIEPVLRPGTALTGLAQYKSFVDERVAQDALREAVATAYHPLDDERVVVDGRIRWSMAGGGHRDSPVVWAMVFRDGLLYRSWPCESVADATRKLDDWLVAQAAQDD